MRTKVFFITKHMFMSVLLFLRIMLKYFFVFIYAEVCLNRTYES